MAKVATITLNAAYDLVGRLPRIEIGEVNTVETLGIFPAGKGINVAKVLKDLGVEVAVGGFLGKITSVILKPYLKNKAWKTNSIVLQAKPVLM